MKTFRFSSGSYIQLLSHFLPLPAMYQRTGNSYSLNMSDPPGTPLECLEFVGHSAILADISLQHTHYISLLFFTLTSIPSDLFLYLLLHGPPREYDQPKDLSTSPVGSFLFYTGHQPLTRVLEELNEQEEPADQQSHSHELHISHIEFLHLVASVGLVMLMTGRTMLVSNDL